jgi:hypothetical protein
MDSTINRQPPMEISYRPCSWSSLYFAAIPRHQSFTKARAMIHEAHNRDSTAWTQMRDIHQHDAVLHTDLPSSLWYHKRCYAPLVLARRTSNATESVLDFLTANPLPGACPRSQAADHFPCELHKLSLKPGQERGQHALHLTNRSSTAWYVDDLTASTTCPAWRGCTAA